MRRFFERSVAIIKVALGLATLFSLWAVFLGLFQGFQITLRGGGPTIPVVVIVAVYMIGGLLAGVIVSLLYPLVRWKVGAAVVGMIAGTPISIGIAASLAGFGPWDDGLVFAAVLTAVVLGGGVGVGFREIFYEEADETGGE